MTALKLSARLPINGLACALKPLVPREGLGYRLPVAANSATGFGDPSSKRRTSAHTDCRRFFCARKSVLWRPCVGDRKVCRVPFAPVRQPAHGCLPSFGDDGGSSYQQKELHPMIPTRNPSTLLARAAAHRAMAMAALSADSSLSSRLRRYNHHMSIARSLQALEASASHIDCADTTAYGRVQGSMHDAWEVNHG